MNPVTRILLSEYAMPVFEANALVLLASGEERPKELMSLF
jgi:hypothetical protein